MRTADSGHPWKWDGGMAWKRKRGVSAWSPPNFLSVWRIFLGETLGNEMFGEIWVVFFAQRIRTSYIFLPKPGWHQKAIYWTHIMHVRSFSRLSICGLSTLVNIHRILPRIDGMWHILVWFHCHPYLLRVFFIQGIRTSYKYPYQ